MLLTLVGLWLASGWALSEKLAARLAFGYGVLALFGWVSVMIVGMTYKIVPFLVWHHRYSDLVGLRPVPPATQLLGALLPQTGFWLLHAATVTLTAGMILESGRVLQAGTIVLALAALGLVRIYRHLAPSLTPLPEAQAIEA